MEWLRTLACRPFRTTLYSLTKRPDRRDLAFAPHGVQIGTSA
jgi:hypothetical protein